MLTANRTIGIILIVFSSIVWFIASGFPEQNISGPGTAFFPQLMAVLMVIIALGLIFINPVPEEQTKIQKVHLIQFLSVIVSVFFYIVLIPRVGFAVTTLLFTFVLITILAKSTILKKSLTSIIITAIVYGIFKFLFNVPLPQGMLF